MDGLSVDALSVDLDRRPIIDAVTFATPSSSITVVVGPNGAGKSTLLRAVAGVLPRREGAIRFRDAELGRTPRRQWAQIVALVEQAAPGTVPLSVRHVVELGRIPHRSMFASPDEGAAIIANAIAGMGLGPLVAQRFDRLSGGEQQRAQIARAMAQEPQLLLLDEPTNHLDVRAQLDVLNVARRAAQRGCAVLMTSHDLNHAAAVGDRILVLRDGRVYLQGEPWDVLTPALIEDIYGVSAAVLPHPRSGRPLIVLD